MKKHILITNDDGFDAVGIKYLLKTLKPLANITLMAPNINKSACAHSMTLDRPLKMTKLNANTYNLDGTPTDCVFVSLHTLMKDKKPDLLISGINIGSNLGEDTTYSGTVGAAMEGVLHDIPSIAISQVFNNLENIDSSDKWDFSLACQAIYKISKQILDNKFPLDKRKLLNINIPYIKPNQCKGIKITTCGHRNYGDDIRSYYSPKGDIFHWIGLHPLAWRKDNNKQCDFEAIKDDYISITPIQLDLTSYNDIDTLKQWIDSYEL